VEELWGQGNTGVADEIIASHYTVHDPGTPGRAGGVEGEKQAIVMYRTVIHHQALVELGQAIKTVFLCHYLHGAALRREINEGLKAVENWDNINKLIFYRNVFYLS
jgi:hypothetical protein